LIEILEDKKILELIPEHQHCYVLMLKAMLLLLNETFYQVNQNDLLEVEENNL